MHLLFLDESGQLAGRRLFALGGVTGWFGRGESEGASAASHARRMNEAAASIDEEDGEEPVSLHAAFARQQVAPQRRRSHRSGT